MGAPASNGRLCTKLSEMLVGDYIKCEYVALTANVVGSFQNLGVESTLSELPATPASTANGFGYFIKVDKGLLIFDRAVQSSISGQAINTKGYLIGIVKNLCGISCLIRSLSRREFVEYLSNSDLDGNVIKQDINVWHNSNNPKNDFNVRAYPEINQDRRGITIRMSGGLSGDCDNTYSIYTPRGSSGSVLLYESYTSSTKSSGYEFYYYSFRPALEYIDNKKSMNIWM